MDLNLQIVLGDLLKEDADVIVNPANRQLLHGGGLCGAIFNAILATGEDNYQHLQSEISKLPSKQGKRCNYGQAVITTAPGLKQSAIIHTVGAISTKHDKEKQYLIIRSAYFESMKLANINGFKVIAFPLISTGIYGCSKKLSAKALVDACQIFMERISDRTLKQVKLVVLTEDEFGLF